MASRAPRVLLCLAALQNFYVGGLRDAQRSAVIRAVEMACYASLSALLMLFFARHASLSAQSKTLPVLVGSSYHSMRRAD